MHMYCTVLYPGGGGFKETKVAGGKATAAGGRAGGRRGRLQRGAGPPAQGGEEYHRYPPAQGRIQVSTRLHPQLHRPEKFVYTLEGGGGGWKGLT